jgi:hypothetical protein
MGQIVQFILSVAGLLVLICFCVLLMALPLALVFCVSMLVRDIWKTRER